VQTLLQSVSRAEISFLEILISGYGASISHNNVFGNVAVFQIPFEYMALVSKAKTMITQRRKQKASVVI